MRRWLLVLLCLPCLAAPPVARDLASVRASFKTKLVRQGPSPQAPEVLKLPKGVREVTYRSGGLMLKAWLSELPKTGQLPAVVFCHGGFSFGLTDWTVDAMPFVKAGFIVLAPMLRGENGNPGSFEFFYGEADDAVAAGRYLSSLPRVDPKRIYITGHSAGGTLAVMAAMMNSPYALAAPIGAACDVRSWMGEKELMVMDTKDRRELENRSAVLFAASIRTPLHLYVGDRDSNLDDNRRLQTLATHFKKPCTTEMVPGDHFTCKAEAIKRCVRLFKARSVSPAPGPA